MTYTEIENLEKFNKARPPHGVGKIFHCEPTTDASESTKLWLTKHGPLFQYVERIYHPAQETFCIELRNVSNITMCIPEDELLMFPR